MKREDAVLEDAQRQTEIASKLMEREAELETKEKDLANKQGDLLAQETDLKAKREDLNAREDALKEDKEILAGQLDVIVAGLDAVAKGDLDVSDDPDDASRWLFFDPAAPQDQVDWNAIWAPLLPAYDFVMGIGRQLRKLRGEAMQDRAAAKDTRQQADALRSEAETKDTKASRKLEVASEREAQVEAREQASQTALQEQRDQLVKDKDTFKLHEVDREVEFAQREAKVKAEEATSQKHLEAANRQAEAIKANAEKRAKETIQKASDEKHRVLLLKELLMRLANRTVGYNRECDTLVFTKRDAFAEQIPQVEIEDPDAISTICQGYMAANTVMEEEASKRGAARVAKERADLQHERVRVQNREATFDAKLAVIEGLSEGSIRFSPSATIGKFSSRLFARSRGNQLMKRINQSPEAAEDVAHFFLNVEEQAQRARDKALDDQERASEAMARAKQMEEENSKAQRSIESKLAYADAQKLAVEHVTKQLAGTSKKLKTSLDSVHSIMEIASKYIARDRIQGFRAEVKGRIADAQEFLKQFGNDRNRDSDGRER